MMPFTKVQVFLGVLVVVVLLEIAAFHRAGLL
jgi:hypothetical protein